MKKVLVPKNDTSLPVIDKMNGIFLNNPLSSGINIKPISLQVPMYAYTPYLIGLKSIFGNISNVRIFQRFRFITIREKENVIAH
jgi:hypothetical protein